jgi:hypothetical protein
MTRARSPISRASSRRAPHRICTARECAANTWYAIGAIHRRQGKSADATAAFGEALARIPGHPMARAALGHRPRGEADGASLMEIVTVRAAHFALTGQTADAARVIDQALAFAPPGNAAWLLPLSRFFTSRARRNPGPRPRQAQIPSS